MARSTWKGPFVDAYVDVVDLAARRITVDWQPDY